MFLHKLSKLLSYNTNSTIKDINNNNNKCIRQTRTITQEKCINLIQIRANLIMSMKLDLQTNWWTNNTLQIIMEVQEKLINMIQDLLKNQIKDKLLHMDITILKESNLQFKVLVKMKVTVKMDQILLMEKIILQDLQWVMIS